MFSNHININILGSAIDESEAELHQIKGISTSDSMIKEGNKNNLDVKKPDLTQNKEKLKIHFINYKKQ